MTWTHRALGWFTAGKACAATPLQSNTASCLGFVRFVMLSMHRLVLVPCKLSMPQEVGVCILSMAFIAPANAIQQAGGTCNYRARCIDRSWPYAEWKDTRSSGNTHLRNV